jgi:hypothetical protein
MGKNIERLGRRNEKNGTRLRDGKEKGRSLLKILEKF